MARPQKDRQRKAPDDEQRKPTAPKEVCFLPCVYCSDTCFLIVGVGAHTELTPLVDISCLFGI